MTNSALPNASFTDRMHCDGKNKTFKTEDEARVMLELARVNVIYKYI